jgi:hypothetical protein
MSLTDKHISDDYLDNLILVSEIRYKQSGQDWYKSILDACLELKQRRAEEKQTQPQKA